jgi:hypothetical protein
MSKRVASKAILFHFIFQPIPETGLIWLYESDLTAKVFEVELMYHSDHCVISQRPIHSQPMQMRFMHCNTHLLNHLPLHIEVELGIFPAPLDLKPSLAGISPLPLVFR